MFIDKRVLKDGSHYYSFSFKDKNGKRIRLKRSDHPHFTDLASATTWAKSQRAYQQSCKALIDQKTAWKSQFYDFQSLIAKYAKWQAVQAPNSWKNNILYFEQYVLPWFLGEKKQNNVNGWHFLFQDFISHLREDCKTSRGGHKIAVATGNRIIHTLNSFLRFLATHHLIDMDSNRKCPAFPEHLENQKSIEDVIPPDEFAVIYKKLAFLNQDSADFFGLLYNTGLRVNEGLSLPISALFKGEIAGSMHEELKEKKVDYIGYIVLESQCDFTARRRDEKTFAHIRKPLKGRKKIHNKDSRIVPIRDKTTWNMLIGRYKAQKLLLDKETYGRAPINYLFFDDLTMSRFSQDIKTVYAGTKYKVKSPHSCRHSFATIFTGETRSFFLAKMILGHKSKAFEGYLHIYEQLTLNSKRNSQDLEEVS